MIKHYDSQGREAVYDPATDTCSVAVRGTVDANGRIITQGSPSDSEKKIVARFTLETNCARLVCPDGQAVPDHPVVDTFHDALADCRDLLGEPIFRHEPADDTERRLFAAACKAAQKVRSNSNILGINKLVFSLNPSLFAFVDCFACDSSGTFWLMSCNVNRPANFFDSFLPLAAYILEAGEYIPSPSQSRGAGPSRPAPSRGAGASCPILSRGAGASSPTPVRLCIWSFFPTGPRFAEIRNDRIAARDTVIAHLLSTPF